MEKRCPPAALKRCAEGTDVLPRDEAPLAPEAGPGLSSSAAVNN